MVFVLFAHNSPPGAFRQHPICHCVGLGNNLSKSALRPRKRGPSFESGARCARSRFHPLVFSFILRFVLLFLLRTARPIHRPSPQRCFRTTEPLGPGSASASSRIFFLRAAIFQLVPIQLLSLFKRPAERAHSWRSSEFLVAAHDRSVCPLLALPNARLRARKRSGPQRSSHSLFFPLIFTINHALCHYFPFWMQKPGDRSSGRRAERVLMISASRRSNI